MRRGGLVHDEELLARTRAERVGALVLRPFQLFARRQAGGGVLLLACAVLALAWANSPWAASYQQLLQLPLGITVGEFGLHLDLRQGINDGLMAVFFFGVGLEIKREFLVGELAERRHAMLPIAAAVGGMAVPALIYAAFNARGAGAHGWGIPMATDIAFALGALAVLGPRVPEALKVFLVALAIVDDLGALLVIALFYTGQLHWGAVALAAVGLAALLVANRAGLRNGPIYLLLGLWLWGCLYVSGLHATLAGVLTALMVPARPRILATALADVVNRGAAALKLQAAASVGALDADHFGAISVLSRTLDAANSPLQRFEHMVQPWVTFGILPAFALFNAGVVIDAAALRDLGNAVPMGIVCGLVVGKPLGIGLASWLALKLGLATLPQGVTRRHMAGVACLAGIGFTMALFISGLAFPGSPFEHQAKLAILLGSLLAAGLGLAILLTTPRQAGPDRS